MPEYPSGPSVLAVAVLSGSVSISSVTTDGLNGIAEAFRGLAEGHFLGVSGVPQLFG